METSQEKKLVEESVFSLFKGVLANPQEHAHVYPIVCRAEVLPHDTASTGPDSSVWLITLVPPSWVAATTPTAAQPTYDQLQTLIEASKGCISHLALYAAKIKLNQEFEYPVRRRIPDSAAAAAAHHASSGEKTLSHKITAESVFNGDIPLCIGFRWKRLATSKPVHVARSLPGGEKRTNTPLSAIDQKPGLLKATSKAVFSTAGLMVSILAGTAFSRTAKELDDEDERRTLDGLESEARRRKKRARLAARPSSEHDDNVVSSDEEVRSEILHDSPLLSEVRRDRARRKTSDGGDDV